MASTNTIILRYLRLFLLVFLAVAANRQQDSLYENDYVLDVHHSGRRRLTANAKTTACRQVIEFEFMKYVRAFYEETPLPFEDIFFHSQCPEMPEEMPPMPVFMRDYPKPPDYAPPPEPDRTSIDPNDLSIMYVMLVHDHPTFATRIIDALDEPQHTFVIHVDLKASNVHTTLTRMAEKRKRQNVFVMGLESSHRVNWGGYSVVNATVNAMYYALHAGRTFHYLQLISGTSYPIKSNVAIRTDLSQHPGAIYMDVSPGTNQPDPVTWYHYVECDDALHRIARLSVPRGMHMYIGSQWFAIPYHVVQWLVEDMLPFQYSLYAQYIVVADENFFATLIMNSPYCGDLIRRNSLFLLFDKWENERNDMNTRDRRKCLSPDPDQCGRSPSTLTMQFKRLLEASRASFARKFDPSNAESMALVDVIDRWRDGRATRALLGAVGDEGKRVMIRFSGMRKENDAHGLGTVVTGMINNNHQHHDGNSYDGNNNHSEYVDQTTRDVDDDDLCWEMSPHAGSPILLLKCDPTVPGQWFTVGPCTEGSNVTFVDGKCPLPQSDRENPQSEMFCQLSNIINPLPFNPLPTQSMQRTSSSSLGNDSNTEEMRARSRLPQAVAAAIGLNLIDDSLTDGLTENSNTSSSYVSHSSLPPLCVDLSGESMYPGSSLIAWECSGQWNQLFSFMPDCTISTTQPEVIGRVRGIDSQNVTFCFAPKQDTSNHGDSDAHSGVEVESVHCVPELNPLMTKLFGGKQTNKTTIRELKNLALRRMQQYEFILQDGNAVHELYEKNQLHYMLQKDSGSKSMRYITQPLTTTIATIVPPTIIKPPTAPIPTPQGIATPPSITASNEEL